MGDIEKKKKKTSNNGKAASERNASQEIALHVTHGYHSRGHFLLSDGDQSTANNLDLRAYLDDGCRLPAWNLQADLQLNGFRYHHKQLLNVQLPGTANAASCCTRKPCLHKLFASDDHPQSVSLIMWDLCWTSTQPDSLGSRSRPTFRHSLLFSHQRRWHWDVQLAMYTARCLFLKFPDSHAHGCGKEDWGGDCTVLIVSKRSANPMALATSSFFT